MAELTVQASAVAGTAITFGAAAAGGDSFNNTGANAGRVILLVKNGDASGKTVTVNSQVPCNQGFDHDQAVTVAAGATEAIGPFAPDRWNDSSGLVQVTYSAVTSVTVAAVRV